MAIKSVTQEEIIIMNELYLKLNTYAAVAREVGRSAGTVKKYIVENFVPQADLEVVAFDKYWIKPIAEVIRTWDGNCDLDEEEKKELEKFNKEVAL